MPSRQPPTPPPTIRTTPRAAADPRWAVSDADALEGVEADALLQNPLGPLLGAVQAVIAVVAALHGGHSGHIAPFGGTGDELQSFAHGVDDIRNDGLAPHDQVEAGSASERRDVDDAVDVVPQHAGEGVLDGVQSRSRDLALVRLHEAHVEVRDRIALGSALDADQTHVRRRDGGVVEGEALYIGHGILLIV